MTLFPDWHNPNESPSDKQDRERLESLRVRALDAVYKGESISDALSAEELEELRRMTRSVVELFGRRDRDHST